MKTLAAIGWGLAVLVALLWLGGRGRLEGLQDSLDSLNRVVAADSAAFLAQQAGHAADSTRWADELAASNAALDRARSASPRSRAGLERLAADTSLPDHVRAVADTAARTLASLELAYQRRLAAGDSAYAACQRNRTQLLGRIGTLEIQLTRARQLAQDAIDASAPSPFGLGLTLGPGVLLTPPDRAGGFPQWRMVSGWCGIAGAQLRLPIGDWLGVGGTAGVGACAAESRIRPGAGANLGIALHF